MLRYAITDRRRLAPDEPGRRAALLQQAARWAAEGIDFLQMREKDLPPADLADLARAVMATLESHASDVFLRPRLLINSRADVAVAAGADGVHLTSGPGQLTPAQIRILYSAANRPEPTVSISCHSLSEVISARDAGSDLILFGPVFEKVIATSTDAYAQRRVGEGTGLGLLREACTAAGPVRVLALGGITAENTAACLHAGAAGIAAIRLFSIDGTALVE